VRWKKLNNHQVLGQWRKRKRASSEPALPSPFIQCGLAFLNLFVESCRIAGFVYRLPTVIALALREEHRLAADGAWYGSRTLFHGVPDQPES